MSAVYAWSAICCIVKGNFSLWRISPFAREYRYNPQCCLLRAFAQLIYALCPTYLCSTTYTRLIYAQLYLCHFFFVTMWLLFNKIIQPLLRLQMH